MTTATAIAIFHEKAYAARPAAERVRKISSGAYATDESASLAKTGSAIRFGSRVSPSRSLRRARPTRSRLRTPPGKGTRTMVASGLRAQCAAAPEHRGLADLRPGPVPRLTPVRDTPTPEGVHHVRRPSDDGRRRRRNGTRERGLRHPTCERGLRHPEREHLKVGEKTPCTW